MAVAECAIDWPQILAAEHRSEAFVARDRYRHPQQTLAFFELCPEQTVVEIWPGGGGWYTELLAPLLRQRGKLYAAHFSAESDVAFFRRSLQRYRDKLAQYPQVYDRVVITTLQPPEAVAIAPAGTADRVLTFRNVHNWMKQGTAEQAFAAFFQALRPGGLLGVVEHRARPGTDLQAMIDSGYVTEAYVTELAVAAGFEWVAGAEINANASDSTDHPRGVWALPPTLRLGDERRAHYLAVGESDRMTLKFRKPGP